MTREPREDLNQLKRREDRTERKVRMPKRLEEESRMECQVKMRKAGEKQARQGLEFETHLGYRDCHVSPALGGLRTCAPAWRSVPPAFILSPGHVLPKEGFCGI